MSKSRYYIEGIPIIAILPMLLFYALIWHAPFIPKFDLTWYIVVAFAFLTILFSGLRFSLRGLGLFWTILILQIIGGLLALLRAPDFDTAFKNIFGFIVSVFAFFLFQEIFKNSKARLYLLIVHLIVMASWVFKIEELIGLQGELYYSSFAETGSNKNHIGIGMALAVVALATIAINPLKQIGRIKTTVLKPATMVLAALFLFFLSLMYARSSLITTAFGILSILFFKYFLGNSLFIGMFKISIRLFILTVVVILAIPYILVFAPGWETMIPDLIESGTESGAASDRLHLFQKGRYLILQNPIVGVGIGGGRNPVAGYRVGLMHNTYLASWVDLGLFGLTSMIIWVIAFIKDIFKLYDKVKWYDKAWFIFILTSMFAMNFKDLSTILLFIISLHMGLRRYYYPKLRKS